MDNIRKRGYYIHFQARGTVGVSKKISMQMNEFKKYYDIEEIDVVVNKVSLIRRILNLWIFSSFDRDYAMAIEKMDNPDFVYIRRTLADRKYMKFLLDIRKKFPDCKIIVEIFTYPYYRDEFLKKFAWLYFFKEIYYVRYYKKCVDRFVTYSNDAYIYGVKTIQTTNGIDVNSIRPREFRIEEKDTISLIGVAYMQKQHGYERVIEGIYKYYKEGGTRKIYCDFIGGGTELSKYKKLVSKYGLEQKINFFPPLTGEKLDEMYDRADLALLSFGWYKSGVISNSSLKTGEYLAKGIPMIAGSDDVVFENRDFKYRLLLTNDKTPIDINKVIEFYDNIYNSGECIESIISNMREFAKEVSDMTVVMGEINKFIDAK